MRLPFTAWHHVVEGTKKGIALSAVEEEAHHLRLMHVPRVRNKLLMLVSNNLRAFVSWKEFVKDQVRSKRLSKQLAKAQDLHDCRVDMPLLAAVLRSWLREVKYMHRGVHITPKLGPTMCHLMGYQ